MTSFDNLTTEQRVRASLHRSTRSALAAGCTRLGVEGATPAAGDLVAELVYRKLRQYGADLEAFAKHAKRNTVNAEDVKLLVRRNPSLKAHIASLPEAAPTKDKRRKSAVPAAAAAPTVPTPAAAPSNLPRTSMEALDVDMEINTTVDLTL